MTNEKQTTNWFEEPLQNGAPSLPEIKKALKEKFGDDKKQIHQIKIKFLNDGNEIKTPDKYNQNKGEDILKRVFEIEWEKNKYVMFVNKSTTEDSFYGQISQIAKKHKGIKNVNCVLTITGKLGEKSMRYAVEEDATASPQNTQTSSNLDKDMNELEFKAYNEIDLINKENKGAHESDLSKRLFLSPDTINDLTTSLSKKGLIEMKVKDGLEYWYVKKVK